MVRAAVFGAEQRVCTGLRRLEPKLCVATGNNVLLDSEGRDVEAVYHVLGRHRQLDARADWHVKLVDLALTGLVLELPHPLLRNDVNLHRVSRRAVRLEVGRSAP